MLNTAIIMGRLTADPELRHTGTNVAVTSFTVAVDRRFNKPGEDRQADFIDVVAWRNQAEFITRYFNKGSMIAIQGAIQTRSYTDNQGVKRKAFEIMVDQASFCGSKRDSEGGGRFDAPQQQAAPSFSTGAPNDFEEVQTDDDFPF